MWQPSLRYPDASIEILDPSFAPYRIFSAAVERLASGTRWGEGPVWFGDGRYFLWSDIPNNRILRWEEETGAVSIFRKPSEFANGNTRDRQGRLITCEHGGRRVTRTEYDGAITVLMDRFQGKRLNSPNDIVVKSDDSIWFTDPPFGLARQLRRRAGTAGAAAERLPDRCRDRRGDRGRRRRSAARTGLPSRLTRRSFYIVESRATPNRLILSCDVLDGRRGSPIGASSSMRGRARPTDFVAMSTAISGAAGAWEDELDGVVIFNPGRQADRAHSPA